MTRDWSRLARYVLDRRNELGLTQEEVAGRGGPSTATIRLIETRGQDAYRAKSLRQLAEALGWTAGSPLAILNGREPQLRPAPAPAPAPQLQLRPAPAVPRREHPGRFQVIPGDTGMFRARGETINMRAMDMVTGVLGPDAAELRAVIQAAGPGATGGDIFDDPTLAGLWDMVRRGACSEGYALALMSLYVLRRRSETEAATPHLTG